MGSAVAPPIDQLARLSDVTGTAAVGSAPVITSAGPVPVFSYTPVYSRSEIDTSLGFKANLDSPTFTGNPRAPTADPGTNSGTIATTAFANTAVAVAIDALKGTAPELLNTLGELSDAIADNEDFAGSMVTLLAGKAALNHTHGEYLETAWIGFFPAELYGASPSNTAAQNAAAIQAALDAADAAGGGTVTLYTPGVYLLTQGVTAIAVALNTALHISSKCSIVLGHGVTLKLDTRADCYMLRNDDPTGGNADIGIFGGTWDGNYLNQIQNLGASPYWFAHSVWMDNVARLTVDKVRGTNALKYVFWLTRVTDFTATDLTFDTPSDGIHLGGGCTRGFIANIQGTTGDNTVGLVTNEGTYFGGLTGISGNITHITIEDVLATDTAEPVRMTGKSPDTISDITVRNVKGSLEALAVCAVNLTDDATGGLTGCEMTRILIDGVDMSGGVAGGASVQISSATARDAVIRNVTMRAQRGVNLAGAGLLHVVVDGLTNHGIINADAVAVSGTVAHLTLRSVYQRLPAAGSANLLQVTGSIARLVGDDWSFAGAAGAGAAIFVNGAAAVLTDGRLGHLLCDSATYCFRSSGTAAVNVRGGTVRLKDTTYLCFGGVTADLDSLQLEGTSTGRTNGALAKAHTAPRWQSYQVPYTSLSAAASTTSAILGTLPRGAVVHAVRIKHQTPFTGGAISAFTISVGIIGTAAKYAAAFNVFQAAAVGTQQFTATPGVAAVNANEELRAFATSTSANTNAATAGLVDIEVQYSVAALNN